VIFASYFDGCRADREAFWAARRGSFGASRSPFGAGMPDWLGDLFGPPPRADRGGVRYLVLDAIAQQPRHGYEVIQAIEQRSGGAYRPSPGVVYPTLQMLEELGHARVIEQDGRKVYAITEEGTRDLEAHREEVDDFYDRSADQGWERQVEDLAGLARQVALLLKSFKRARRRVSPEAQRRIREVLRESVAKIEAIVAEELRRS
jgi:DNA-binding PadR family transcriptional regulator